MSKTYRSANPNQQGLPPRSIQDRLPESDLVYFLLDTVNELDISAITAKYEQKERDFPPYPPRMMVALLLYSYCRGIFSSRKIMRACQERLTFRAVVGDHIPNWRIISDFRKLHAKELEDLFVQILKFCQRAGLVKLGHIAVGSTKVKANPPVADKAMSYGRMKQEEKRLQYEVHRLLSSAEAVDKQETAVEKARADSKNNEGPNRGRKRTVILDIPVDSDIRPPTWEEAARKCIEVYREVISKYKNCPRR